MNNKKLDDEELSRVLSEHEIGGLARRGAYPSFKIFTPCLYQAALNVPNTDELITEGITLGEVRWFDCNYRNEWTAEEFIEQLEKQELI